MDAYKSYKTLSADLQVERAFAIRWTPELETQGLDDLMDLWDSLTPDERKDLIAWIVMQEKTDIEA